MSSELMFMIAFIVQAKRFPYASAQAPTLDGSAAFLLEVKLRRLVPLHSVHSLNTPNIVVQGIL
jgi:hypothetical protein